MPNTSLFFTFFMLSTRIKLLQVHFGLWVWGELLNPDREAVAATFYQTNNSSNEMQRTGGRE